MVRPGCGVELTTRSDGADLPPVIVLLAGTVIPSKPVELLKAEAEVDAWRLVEAFSRNGLPFDVTLAWSSGSGSGAEATFTISHASRIGVFARSLRVVATNQSNHLNRVGVTIADGFAPTRNAWELRGDLDPAAPTTIAVPPFAETLRVDLADNTLAPTTEVRLVDGIGLQRGTVLVSAQPSGGIPVGGTSRVRLVTTAATRFRAHFTLSL